MVGDLRDIKVAVLGLAFKPETDDVRETRSLPVIKALIRKGAIVAGHDPKAADNFRNIAPSRMTFFDNAPEAVKWSDVVVLMTEWEEYKQVDWKHQRHLMAVVDGRRTVRPSSFGNVKYWSIGSPLP
jgi:UDPglucose 6-dehydrogenase